MNSKIEKLKNYIKDQLLDLSVDYEIEEDFNLLEAGLDSLGIMRLLDFIQREFGISLEEINVTPAAVKTFNLIEKLIKEHGAA